MSVEMEMPRYVSHKQVWALKIKAIEPFGADGMFARLHFEDPRYAPIAVDADWYYGRKPEAGGYYVVYQDGYKSYSPAKVFEEGYTPQNAAHAVQAAPQAGEERPVAPHLSDIEHPEQHARADSPESDGETFAAWLAREIPPGTVISNPGVVGAQDSASGPEGHPAASSRCEQAEPVGAPLLHRHTGS